MQCLHHRKWVLRGYWYIFLPFSTKRLLITLGRQANVSREVRRLDLYFLGMFLGKKDVPSLTILEYSLTRIFLIIIQILIFRGFRLCRNVNYSRRTVFQLKAPKREINLFLLTEYKNLKKSPNITIMLGEAAKKQVGWVVRKYERQKLKAVWRRHVKQLSCFIFSNDVRKEHQISAVWEHF